MIDTNPMTGTRAVALLFTTSVTLFTAWLFVAAIYEAIKLIF